MTPDGNLHGRVSVITGGARGIGRAIAQRLAKEGSTVVIMDVLEDEGQRAAAEIVTLGGRARFARVDASDLGQVVAAVDRTASQEGSIDILINNVGYSYPKPFLETDEAYWQKHLDLNVMTVLRFSHAALPHMRSRRFGRIVSLSSVQGRRAAGGALVYGAAKAAIISITRSLAESFAADGIRANAICPGPIETDVLKRLMSESPEYIAPMLKESAMGRSGKPAEIASVACFLCSEESSYITGQSISVDGGMVML